MEAHDILQKARQPGRPSGKTYIQKLCGDFFELRGDRRFGDDHAIIGGIGRLGGMPVTVIAHEKGDNIADRARRNFGMAHPEGYRKALRLMQQAEKFGRPVLCLVDTAGAFCASGAEERGQGYAIAENLTAMMNLGVPVITLLLGEGGSGGALALAVADQVWMMENSVYSVISPEGCSSILWKTANKVKDATEALKMTPQDLLALGVIERIVPEHPAGAALYNILQRELCTAFAQLSAMDRPALLQQRYQRFRKMGVYKE